MPIEQITAIGAGHGGNLLFTAVSLKMGAANTPSAFQFFQNRKRRLFYVPFAV
jgi:hypothetical protein